VKHGDIDDVAAVFAGARAGFTAGARNFALTVIAANNKIIFTL
jgi:hypothetical protein